MAISGTAACPNMGYHSSPRIAFIMALFNMRLGWWLGNPGTSGDTTWQKKGPTLSSLPMLKEMLGLTSDHEKYVYLSNEGHFENLGLYEMVHRCCQFIVIVDVGCDPKREFEDLGQAIVETSQFLTFQLEEELFALDIDKVREVLDFISITKGPRTPGYMRGVINLRFERKGKGRLQAKILGSVKNLC